MIKHVFLLTSLFAFPLHGFFNQLEEMEPDVFTMNDLQNQAADIKATLRDVSYIPEKYLKQIDLVLQHLKSIKLSPMEIKNITQTVRRYQVLAQACLKDIRNGQTEMSDNVQTLLNLFEKREEIVKKIHDTMQPAIFSHVVIHNLRAALGYTPSEEEKAALTTEQKAYVAQRVSESALLNKQLFIIEKEILSDRRSKFEKYSPLIIGSGIFASLVIGLGIALDRRDKSKATS